MQIVRNRKGEADEGCCLVVVLLIVGAIVMASTNPSKPEHIREIKLQVKQKAMGEGFLGQLVSVTGILDVAIDTEMSYSDFGLFSVCTCKDGSVTSVGVFNSVMVFCSK
jgi:hypothetical protein